MRHNAWKVWRKDNWTWFPEWFKTEGIFGFALVASWLLIVALTWSY